MKYTLIGILVLVILFGFGIFSKGVGLYNQEINLKKKIEAKQDENKAIFDNTWKKIKQATNVTDKYKEGFAEVLKAYTSGREVESEQLLVNWTKEAVPNFDSSLYKQLMNIIVSSRDDFTLNQKQLIDLNREHDVLLETFPNNLFYHFLGAKKINITVVTSTKSEEAFETGKEDNIEL